MNESSDILNVESGLKSLSKHTKMKILIDRFGKPDFIPKRNYFHSLMRSIVFQQLSGKAAKTIYDRLIDLIPSGSNITPSNIFKLNNEDMRTAGLSYSKISYVKNLANFFDNNSFGYNDVEKMTDKEIGNRLITIKGIGQWTVDMFLMFTLNRADVLPCSDLGIQKGFKNIFNMDDLPSKKEMEILSETWKPYRTIACWYLWRTVDDGFNW